MAGYNYLKFHNNRRAVNVDSVHLKVELNAGIIIVCSNEPETI